MKDNLMLKTYETEIVPGSFNLAPHKPFFGTPLVDIEDNININNELIFYTQMPSGNTIITEGYQDIISTSLESIVTEDLVDLKLRNHTVSLLQQSTSDKLHNTKWQFNFDIKNMLIDYLYARLKESRAFKCFGKDDLINRDINLGIKTYIIQNLINRYTYDKIELYVKYIDVVQSTNIYSSSNLLYQPTYSRDTEQPAYLTSNLNIKVADAMNNLNFMTAIYQQTQPSNKYKFNYYFNIYFKRI